MNIHGLADVCPPRGRRGTPESQLVRHQAEELALRLLRHGARAGVVHWSTGLKLEVLAGWYRRIHGRAPPRGPLPDHSGSMIRTRTEHLHASLFGVIYAGYHKEGAAVRRIDPHSLVSAYEAYLALADGRAIISINQGWILARDLRSGLAAVAWCPSCQAHYVDLRASILRGCPLCALYARAGARLRRFGEPDGQIMAAHRA